MIFFGLKHTSYLNSKHDYNTLQGELSHYDIFQIPAYWLTLAMPVSSQTFKLHKYTKYLINTPYKYPVIIHRMCLKQMHLSLPIISLFFS